MTPPLPARERSRTLLHQGKRPRCSCGLAADAYNDGQPMCKGCDGAMSNGVGYDGHGNGKDCRTCHGSGEVWGIPWTSWKGRPEQNPENEECGPCPDCHGEGVRPEMVEAFEMLGQLASMPSDRADEEAA